MKDGFRQCMAWLHTWTGLVVGWVLFFVFVTGTAGYFDTEIDRWMRPEWPLATTPAVGAPEMAAQAQRYLATHAQGADWWRITLPLDRESHLLKVAWRQGREAVMQAPLDPSTGERLQLDAVRDTWGGWGLYRMHWTLYYLNEWRGRLVVGLCTMLMLLAIVSGVVTHKKIFSDFFTFRPAKGQRSWLDAHNLISVTALPFFLMITYSGLVFVIDQVITPGTKPVAEWVTGPVDRSTGRAGPVANRGEADASADVPLVSLAPLVRQMEARWGSSNVADWRINRPGREDARIVVTRPLVSPRFEAVEFSGLDGRQLREGNAFRLDGATTAETTEGVLLSLHEGLFAGWSLRWLYFLSGLLGCGMIATGLVLWTVKRRGRQDKRLRAGQSVEFGFRLVEALNIGTIAGLCTAVAAYFWANRLLPAQFASRVEWEFHCMFVAWGLLFLHASLRLRFAPSLRVWQEQLWIAALAYGLIPLLNWATTDRHLGVTVPHGDWVLAGFDLTVLALGAFFVIAALKVRRKLVSAVRAKPPAVRSAAGGTPDAGTTPCT